LVISNRDQSSLNDLSEHLAPHRDELVRSLQEALQATLFANRAYIRLGDLLPVAEEEAEAFLAFLRTGDATLSWARGERRAEQGLREHALLRVGSVLRAFVHAHLRTDEIESVLVAANTYTDALIEGFIHAREAIVLAEQEHIRSALQGALSRYTVQLDTAAEIAQAASSTLDLDTLAFTSVELIRDRFHFHYVGFFLLDETGEWAILRAGTPQAGHVALQQSQRVRVGGPTGVGWCAAHREPHIALDVTADPLLSTDETLLPDTRSAIAVPLVSRGRVIAAMTVQRTHPTASVAEDVAMLQGIANQMANAIENALLYAAAQKDITQRKRVEEQIKTSLQEKEVLLKEIHHRVKNNLQVISSLLHLQANYVKDAQAIDMLRESRDRVRSMALVHEKLYRSKDLARVDLAEYTRNLASHLFRSYETTGRRVQMNIDVGDVDLGIDAAIPCGLIVNELVSNALKHAFPAGRGGEVYIGLALADGQYTLVVRDNGTGFPPGLDFSNTDSLGLQLVGMFVRQLNGAIEMAEAEGTTFRIQFPA
jgi:two-component sensor histidine kinase/putative methionine-R-sulfoxide reductase with GAF domain